ncbi:MAG TPA: GAF domain-containing SpoIIE family protein phosphatase [Bryobacteraceae bacterium]|nr:GAF domain-containing SpoIIE family protein phosphatase [Bryobacteraceae bacterium]
MPSPRAKSPVQFRDRTDLLDFLLEVSTTMAETLDLDDLLANVASIVQRVIPYELFAILLYNEKRQELRIRHAVGHRQDIVRNLVITPGEGIVGTAAQTREPILVPDVRNDPRYLSTSDAVRCELSVPMTARKRLIGVIDVQSAQPGAYTDYHRSLLRLVASRAAATIDNALLYRRAERQYRTIRALSRISHEFSSILDLDELLGKIASSVRTLIDYSAFSILLVDPSRTELRHRFSLRYDQRVSIESIPMGKGITGAAAVARDIVRVHDTAVDPRYIATDSGIRSELAVPLMVKDSVIGVMNLESERVGFFTEDHARTMSLLAPSVAIAIENARLYQELGERERLMQEDLHAAFDLQTVLLPQEAPEVAGLETAIGLRPAREISGDLYDFFGHGDGQMQIAFGDSSGKGAAAALFGAMVNGLMRTLAPRRRKPAELMRALNDTLVHRKVEGRYLTLVMLLWDPESRSFTMANAGGSPPMICREGVIINLQVEGVPLGLLPDRDYEETVFQTRPGDLVVLFSDGVSDHLSEASEEYGSARLAKILQRDCGLEPREIVRNIFADLDGFNQIRFDDQTLIVMRVK